ncbi:MAG: hypothetical protein HPY65_13840 [Syntrophaceae bacterium]|nr:hypothetical protein [Syntrophaceae bacterium]
MEPMQYEIGDKVYVQKPLVLGQIRQLLETLIDFRIPAEFTSAELINLLGSRLPAVLAVVLTEKDRSPKGKDLSAFADELEFTVSAETALKVVDDFFVCNPISSLFERMSGMMGKVAEGLQGRIDDLFERIADRIMAEMLKRIGSKTSSAPSPAETSPDETRSSGDSPSMSADRT